MAFFVKRTKGVKVAVGFSLSDAARKWLSTQARTSIDNGLTNAGKAMPVPEAAAPLTDSDVAQLSATLGAFVTLNINKRLRGCIGAIVGNAPLYANVWNMAHAAAFKDPRFPPLKADEWLRCTVDISVLEQPTLCPNPLAIEVGKHGLILQHNGHTGVFLPQVPVEQGWDRAAYLEHLCGKAGLPKGSWEQPGARLFWYEALVFEA